MQITDLMAPAQADFADVYMVAELMDTDLHRVIYSGQRLTEEHVQFFLYQLLCGIRHIHSADVIHRCVRTGVGRKGEVAEAGGSFVRSYVRGFR